MNLMGRLFTSTHISVREAPVDAQGVQNHPRKTHSGIRDCTLNISGNQRRSEQRSVENWSRNNLQVLRNAHRSRPDSSAHNSVVARTFVQNEINASSFIPEGVFDYVFEDGLGARSEEHPHPNQCRLL